MSTPALVRKINKCMILDFGNGGCLWFISILVWVFGVSGWREGGGGLDEGIFRISFLGLGVLDWWLLFWRWIWDFGIRMALEGI